MTQHASAAGPGAAPPTADRSGVRSGPLWAFRAAATLELAALLIQAMTAGGILDDAALGTFHGSGSTLVHLFGLALLVSGVLVWRPGRGPLWPAVAGLVVLLAGFVQSMLGGSGSLLAHVPTGVALTVITTWLVVWSWTQPRMGGRR